MEKINQFPKKVRLGPNATGYLASDIEAWLEGRIEDGNPDRIKGIVQKAMGQEYNVILRPAQVAQLLNISLPTLWRWERGDADTSTEV